MTVNGWTWDKDMGRWYVQKGTSVIVVRLPKHSPPEDDAALFSGQARGVNVIQGGSAIQVGDGGTQNNVFG